MFHTQIVDEGLKDAAGKGGFGTAPAVEEGKTLTTRIFPQGGRRKLGT